MIKLDSTFHPSLNFFHAVKAGLSGTPSSLSFWLVPQPHRAVMLAQNRAELSWSNF